MMQTPLMRAILLLAALGSPLPGFTETGLTDAVLQRFHETGLAEYRYEETRTLELLATPWKGKGYLYSAPDGTLVKLQITPERAIMAIAGERLYYYDDARQQRQSLPMELAGATADQVRRFRAIVQGRGRELGETFDARSETRADGLRLVLTARTPVEGSAIARLELSGDTSHRQLQILQADGERSAYILHRARSGVALEPVLKGLLAEARGE